MKKAISILAAAVLATTAFAGGAFALTTAGTQIDTTATATYTIGGTPFSQPSNTSTIYVAALVAVNVTNQDGGNIPVLPGALAKASKFLVTNTGNVAEIFTLTANSTAQGGVFDPTLSSPFSIYVDNGDGTFSSVTDTGLANGGTIVSLNPGANKTIFVVNDIPASAGNTQTGKTQLIARDNHNYVGSPGATVGTGNTGAPNQYDIVIAQTNGQNATTGTYVVSTATVSVVKSSTISNATNVNGANISTSPIPGAKVTYSIVVTVGGSGTVTGLKVVDAVPTNTTYVANSITLDSAPVTDAVGFDAAGNKLNLSVGDLTAPSTKTVTFAVTIN
jgi:hypothetical protein